MAMRFTAGARRGLWQCLKQVVGDSSASCCDGKMKITVAGFGPSRSAARELLTDSAWRGCSAKAISIGRNSPGRLFDREASFGSSYGKGLRSLLSNREDAVLTWRSFLSSASAPIVRRSANQLSRSRGRSDGCITSAATAVAGGRELHSLAGGKFCVSVLVKRQIEEQFWCSKLISIATTSSRRNLGSESWIEKFKNAVNLKPKVNTRASSVGLKSGSIQGRPREILSEITKPVQRTFSHYREAVGLQVEAFWKRNYLVVVGFLGLGVCLLLWRIMFGIASTFVSLSEGMAKFGFLALAAAMVVLGGVILRARFTINPDAVYRVAMRKLNTSAAVLEVMGAPLSGTDLRAYIMSGGGLRLKNFRPRLAGKRCFIIFPIQGSERRGLVSIEVKKKKGQYDFKLLAVDVPTAGADQRLYLIGDESEYKVGGGLISELRDPMVKAMAAQKEFEELDIKEEEEDERRELEAESLRADELDRIRRETSTERV